jgi:hypothetical protein
MLPTAVDCVLVDDDLLVQFAWKIAAEKADKKLLIFSSAAELLAHISHIPLMTPVYLDSDLKSNIRGEELAKILRKNGFTQLYLATGFDEESFGHLPWVTAVVGKDPPWR